MLNYNWAQSSSACNCLKLCDLITCYHIIRETFNVDLSHLFVINTDEHLRGHNLCYTVRPTLQDAFSHWNNLPYAVVEAASVNQLKNLLDEYLFCANSVVSSYSWSLLELTLTMFILFLISLNLMYLYFFHYNLLLIVFLWLS